MPGCSPHLVLVLMTGALLQDKLYIAAQMSYALLQDESCIAAHLGERAPKLADDELAAIDQQDNTENVDAQDGLGDSTGNTLAVVVLLISRSSNLDCTPGKARKQQLLLLACCRWCL